MSVTITEPARKSYTFVARSDGWTEERKLELRTLRDQGFTQKEIGARLGVSEDAIVGAVRRMGLPPVLRNAIARAERTTRQPFWTAERDAVLIGLWAQPMSAAEIGRRMGASKNSIVGRSDRLHLARRPSPILPPSDKPKPAWRGKVALKAFATEPASGSAPFPRERGGQLKPGPTLTPIAAVLPSAAAPKYIPSGGCLWPLWGNSERPTHRYCDGPRAGQSYCAKHAAVAFQSVPRFGAPTEARA